MGEDRRERALLWTMLVLFALAFFLMVTTICSPNWYETYPIVGVKTPMGSIGLLEHCTNKIKKCVERNGILGYHSGFWPYRPLENIHYDITLSLLISTMFATFCAAGLTLFLCFNMFRRLNFIKWALLALSSISAILGISSVAYFDSQLRNELLKFSWCSYLAWVAVFLLLLSNLPVIWMLWKKPSNDYPNEFHPLSARENVYAIPERPCEED